MGSRYWDMGIFGGHSGGDDDCRPSQCSQAAKGYSLQHPIIEAIAPGVTLGLACIRIDVRSVAPKIASWVRQKGKG